MKSELFLLQSELAHLKRQLTDATSLNTVYGPNTEVLKTTAVTLNLHYHEMSEKAVTYIVEK